MRHISLIFIGLLLLVACKPEEVYIDGNNVPNYADIPTLRVEQYVNSVFIDMLGRAATDQERGLYVSQLESAGNSIAARKNFVAQLQNASATESEFYYKLYTDLKGKYLNSSTDASVEEEFTTLAYIAHYDSLQGNYLVSQLEWIEANKVLAVLSIPDNMQNIGLAFNEACRIMMYNSIYDDLNMGTFNFVNASFDQNFFRFPTQSEFDNVYNSIEVNTSGVFFGQTISSKQDYLDVLIHSNEFFEGGVRWMYRSYLSRDASDNEVYVLLDVMKEDQGYLEVQQVIFSSDEYAGF